MFLALSGTMRQVFVTLCTNLLSVSYGTSIGWASTSLPFLASNATVLSKGPLTKEGNEAGRASSNNDVERNIL